MKDFFDKYTTLGILAMVLIAGCLIVALIVWIRGIVRRKRIEKAALKMWSTKTKIEDNPLSQLDIDEAVTTDGSDWHYSSPIPETKANKIEDRERDIDWELMKKKETLDPFKAVTKMDEALGEYNKKKEEPIYVAGIDPYREDEESKSKIIIGKIVDGVMEYAIEKEREDSQAMKFFTGEEQREIEEEVERERKDQSGDDCETMDEIEKDDPIYKQKVGDATWKGFTKEGELERIEVKEDNLREGEDELLALALKFLKQKG